eukprot:3224399-Alexandrium_andersonii.AAC.1
MLFDIARLFETVSDSPGLLRGISSTFKHFRTFRAKHETLRKRAKAPESTRNWQKLPETDPS